MPSRAETVALWMFDEPAGVYPSTTLGDNGPNDYTIVLGRGAQIVEGKFGQALQPSTPLPLTLRGGSALFGLKPTPRQPGRTVEPLTWETANFAALLTSGERHLRHMEFANASDTRLNLGAFDWTVEFWLATPSGATGEGVLFELGAGPRGENDHVTRLSLRPGEAAFTFLNQASGTTLVIPTDPAGLQSNQWHHFAFVYAAGGGQLRHYVDGALQTLPAPAQIKALEHGDEAYLSIGRDGLWGRPLTGRLDELRFSTGLVYTGPFTPPASFSRTWNTKRPEMALQAGPPLLFSAKAGQARVLELGSRKHLFIDDALVARSENVTFQVNPPSTSHRVRENVSGHTSIVEDENGLLRIYCQGPDDSLAVLTSRDGLNWEQPDLGRGEFKGLRNVVIRDGVGWGSVFLDPNAPPAERWKYVSGRRGQTIYLYYSADGWQFTRSEATVIPMAAGSQSTIFYDDQRQVYVGHHRSDYGLDAFGGTRRMFMLIEIKDLMQPWPFQPVSPQRTREIARTLPIQNEKLDPWYLDNGPLSPGGLGVEYPLAFAPDAKLDPPGTDIYVPKAIKYPWAPDTYVAFPTVFFHYQGPEARAALGPLRGDGPTECQLAVSRDGLNWKRLRRPAYIGIGQHDGQDLKMIYTTYNLVRRGQELWQYFLGKADYHGSKAKSDARWDLYRVQQRLDGFVSADTPYTGGQLVSRPFRFQGSRFKLNINTGATGYAQVGFLDEAGQPIRGFSTEDCIYINGNAVEYEVEWLRQGKDVSALAGRTVQLIFNLRGTKLYALQFTTPTPASP